MEYENHDEDVIFRDNNMELEYGVFHYYKGNTVNNPVLNQAVDDFESFLEWYIKYRKIYKECKRLKEELMEMSYANY